MKRVEPWVGGTVFLELEEASSEFSSSSGGGGGGGQGEVGFYNPSWFQVFLDTLESTTGTLHSKAQSSLDELCRLAERTIIDQRKEDEAKLEAQVRTIPSFLPLFAL